MEKLSRRDCAAQIVADNWRIRHRLPRITAYAKEIGLITAKPTAEQQLLAAQGLSEEILEALATKRPVTWLY